MNKAIGGLLFAALFIVLLAVSGSDNSAHAQQLQGDVDCDGDVDPSDALWILREAAGLPVSADCMEAAGDVNCDGVIDVLDALAVLLHAAGLPPLDPVGDCVPIGEEIGPGPEPLGPPLTAEIDPDVSIAVDLTVRQDCVGGRSHTLTVEWDVFNATDPVGITITAMPSAGGNILGVSDELSGSETLDLNVQTGGHVIVVVSVEAQQGFASDVAASDLGPCLVVAIPDPGDGFGPGDITIPPGSGTGGDLREVDVAHLGGSTQGPTEPIIVSAAGTGSSIKLTSWTLRGTPPTPFKLDESPPFFGSRVRLHVLTPDITPDLAVELLISASIHNEILWLTTWRVEADGAFTQLDTRGYGPNTRFDVEAFSVDHRPIAGTAPGGQTDTFQVATPVIGESAIGAGSQRALRLITWSVNGANGGINGLQDSGNWGDPSGDPVVDIAHQDGPLYVVGYKDGDDNQVHQYWSVHEQSGLMAAQGVGISGLDIRGVEPVTINGLNDLAMTRLTDDGFITATRLSSADPPFLASWETRVTACDAGCYNSPFKIASHLDDMQAGLGVDLGGPPMLTDTRQDLANGGDRWGGNIATGDFDGDGLDDLAVGVPHEDAGGVEDSGQVDVMYGFADAGSTAFDNDFWTQASPGVATDLGVNELLGDAIAAGNFNGDAYDDLAIGVPREDIGDVVDGGAVHVLYGSAAGLTADGIQFFHKAAPEILKQPGDNDLFGEALTAGDFDGDGRDDLAIGIPYHNLPGIEQAGAVQVLYGAPGGLTGDGEQLWHQGSDDIIGDPEEDDIFGRPLSVGDFDGDGRDDLVAGVTGEDVGDLTSAGSLNVIYGSPSGLASAGNQLWNLDEMGGADGADAFDFFPGGLAAGDFDADGEDELAIGVPNQDRPGADDAGAVYVLAGSGGGLTSAGMQVWDQDTPAFNASAMEFDSFGASLAAGNFNSLGPVELAIGIPSLDTEDAFDAGAVRVLLGSTGVGLIDAGTQLWIQGENDLGGIAEDGDLFGGPLATGDFDGDGFDDLAAAAVFQRVEPWVGDPVSAGGSITIIYGGNLLAGLVADGDQIWTQGIERRIRAMLTDALWEQQFGIGGGVLYEKMPPGENIQNHTASVTKVMTLLLAVEAISDGEVDLDDVVEISKLAADTGGSHCDPLLATGDEMSLRLLLHMMMMCSDNKASVAIAEHVARAYLGNDTTMEDFVDMMNEKAGDIDMLNTLQGHPAGSSATTPQDQITLWMYAIQHDLFRQYAEVKLYDECGETIEGKEKCYFIEKHSDSGYPGLGGWKGGNGLVGESFGLPACVSCLTAEANRLTRKLVTHFQQSGDRWGDADRLFDWGYKTLFAPDLSVQAEDDGGPVLDFAIDNVGDSLAITAVIESTEDLKLCTWNTLVESEQAGIAGCETETIDELPPGPAENVRRALVDIARLSTTFAEGDYVTAYSVPSGIAGEVTVIVQVWRVGPKQP